MDPSVVGPLLVSMHLASRPKRQKRSRRTTEAPEATRTRSLATRGRHASGAMLIALGRRLADSPQAVHPDATESTSAPTL
jgi:hypothetical protein